ncbi:MAG: DUF3467 domain-containing protein [Bryobacteraceae bacterium]|jgi:hypothetical protein
MSDDKVQVRIEDLPHRKSDKFVTLYSNAAGVGGSFFDLQLLFGHVVPMHAKDESFGPYIEDEAAVVMSWEHAKALVSALRNQIEQYEKENGPIRVSK